MHDTISVIGSMFTDWSQTNPRYFYMRGFFTGIILCLVFIPLIKETIKAIFHKRS